ncbi:hypothetical protein SK128_024553 [Halocaridina rubra]|uniref:Uncharacterized protein n=1 Tax=Halocaridina rubra TaxID=373956 RepID=A0AAN8WEP0_HALRR
MLRLVSLVPKGQQQNSDTKGAVLKKQQQNGLCQKSGTKRSVPKSSRPCSVYLIKTWCSKKENNFCIAPSQPNTFKNPVYDSLYNEGASANIPQEEKTGLLHSDPLGALDGRSPNTGSKS